MVKRFNSKKKKISLLNMSRSSKKGPYIDINLMRKISKQKPEIGPIKTWARGSDISPEMVGYTFLVHNGKDFITVRVSEDMIGHKFGEFSPTKKFVRHGGKIQRELEQKQQEPKPATPGK